MSPRQPKSSSAVVSESDVKAALKELLTKQRERGVVEKIMPFREEILAALNEGVTYKELHAVLSEKGVVSTAYAHFCDAMRRFKARVGLPVEVKGDSKRGEAVGIEERRRLHAGAPSVTDFARRSLEEVGKK